MFFLAACQSVTSRAYIVEAEVVEAFQRNKMNLVEIHTPEEEDIFGSKLKRGEARGISVKRKVGFYL
ncbi:3-dehydroquinate synthetase [Solibacillus silvestris StLB046]|uniref:3-dehydroquinate synthetase n=1 Tax=Solibacillus silvestris (strain StLB046) TaxID=1002809 RepID=F2F9F4_SOLSS|nr:3-dehydroquinate synthetase [Solibacillus silvestris StLB046]